jgi:long-chain acyl-CoA synthetase
VLGFSRIRVAYTAGEAIGADLFSFFRSLGVNLKQLYGQTEAFLYVTAQKDGAVRSDTVGPAAPNVDIRIADTARCSSSRPASSSAITRTDKTAEVMTPDGYVKTGDAGFFEKDGQLRIIDRAKDVGKLRSGALFAPKYIENKLKFFPNIKEAVAFGDGRDFATAFINIDLQAVGNWAERNNISYASYQELAGHPQVYKIIARHVDETNRRLAAGADDGGRADQALPGAAQGTRRRRRRADAHAEGAALFIAERYAPLIEALYDGSTEKYVETEVTFEDGRKGNIRATSRSWTPTFPFRAEPARGRGMNAHRRTAGARGPRRRHQAGRSPARGRTTSRCRFGGVKAITDISFDIRKGEIRAIIGPNGAGKTSMLNVINGFYHPQEGRSPSSGETRRKMQPHEAAARASPAPSRTSRCSRACRRSTTSWPAAR